MKESHGMMLDIPRVMTESFMEKGVVGGGAVVRGRWGKGEERGEGGRWRAVVS